MPKFKNHYQSLDLPSLTSYATVRSMYRRITKSSTLVQPTCVKIAWEVLMDPLAKRKLDRELRKTNSGAKVKTKLISSKLSHGHLTSEEILVTAKIPISDVPTATASSSMRKASSRLMYDHGKCGVAHEEEIEKHRPRIEARELQKSREYFISKHGTGHGSVLGGFFSEVRSCGDGVARLCEELKEMTKVKVEVGARMETFIKIKEKKMRMQVESLWEKLLGIELHREILRCAREKYMTSPSWFRIVAKFDSCAVEMWKIEEELNKILEESEGEELPIKRGRIVPPVLKKMDIPYTPATPGRATLGPAIRTSPSDLHTPLKNFKADPRGRGACQQKHRLYLSSPPPPIHPPSSISSASPFSPTLQPDHTSSLPPSPPFS